MSDTKRLLSYARRAVDDYNMIEDGDRIAVGISGGKDSLALLTALAGLRRFYPKKFDILAHRFDTQCTVTRIPAPGLVQFIEANRRDANETKAFLRQLLAPYIGKLDALVLGCTHYPFVKHNIQDILGPQTRVIHGGEGTARETKRRLRLAGLLRQGEGKVIINNSLGDPEIIRLCYELLG